jgi:hypothetical protein
LDDLDEFVGAVAVSAGECDEVSGLLDDGTAFRCGRDGDAASAPKLEQSFVAKEAQRA